MVRRCVPLRSFWSSAQPTPSPFKEKKTLIPPADTHLLSLLNKCSTFRDMNQIHGFMLSQGLDQDSRLLRKFIETCSLLGFRDYAYSVFAHKAEPDVYLYNTMIRVLSQTDSARCAISLYCRIHVEGLRPDTYSFPFVLKAVAHLSSLEVGREIHGQVIRIGLCSDVHVATGLVHMYSSCRDIEDARFVFDELSYRDVVLWNAIVAGYAKLGDLDNARDLFEMMPERNVISWTALIAGYAQMNCPTEAIEIFRRMQLEDNVEPDEIVLLATLSACAHVGALELGEWIHNYIERRGLYKIVPLMNSLIDMYAKSAKIETAVEVFEKMKYRSVVSWTTVIAGLAFHGLGIKALEMFHRMEMEKVKPNDVTFLAILSACSHAGLVDLGWKYFDCMSSRYQIERKIEHYGCMVDLLGRSGFLKEARELVANMPFEPNGAIWGSLLSAARNHGDVELGENALRHLIEKEPHNCGNYTLLSNIYASHEKWDDVGKLRILMRERGLKKLPGGSSIELNSTIHEFTARDASHPHSEKIYEVLYEINGHLKVVGYVPRAHVGLFDFEEG